MDQFNSQDTQRLVREKKSKCAYKDGEDTQATIGIFSAIIQVNIEVDGHKTRENIFDVTLCNWL